MSGLGKKRTKLGAFLDGKKLSQGWLVERSGVSRNEVGRLCDGNKNVMPLAETVQRIISALRKAGHDVRGEDFWN